jgi:hypothetical protein
MVRCSCCSSNSFSRLNVAGKSVQLLGLSAVFERFHDRGAGSDELFRAVRVYNAIPKQLEAEYRQAVMRAFAEYCLDERGDRSITLGG